MRVLDRILLLLVGVALFVKGAALVAASLFSWDVGAFLARLAQQMTGAYRLETVVVGLAEILISFYCLAWCVRRRHREQAVVQETSLGAIRISLKAIEALVQRAARQVQGVREVKTELAVDKQGLGIYLTVTVAPDLSMPEISEEIQHRVERYIAETVGTKVTKVAITFKAITGEGKARVE